MVSSFSTAIPLFGLFFCWVLFFFWCLLILSHGFHQICSLGKAYTDKAYASLSPRPCLVYLSVKLSCSAQTWIFFPSDTQKPWEEHIQALGALHSSLQPQHLTQSSCCIDITGYSTQGCVCVPLCSLALLIWSPFLVLLSSSQKDSSIPFISYNSFPTIPYWESAQALQDNLSPCGAFSWWV